MIRGGKQITPVRFCGHASPHLRQFNLRMDKVATRHAEIGAINCLTDKQRQTRLLKKTTLVVVRFSQRNIGRKRHKRNIRENSFELYLSQSKPCKQCIKVLKMLRLKAVIYVDEKGHLVKKRPHDIDGCVDSGATETS